MKNFLLAGFLFISGIQTNAQSLCERSDSILKLIDSKKPCDLTIYLETFMDSSEIADLMTFYPEKENPFKTMTPQHCKDYTVALKAKIKSEEISIRQGDSLLNLAYNHLTKAKDEESTFASKYGDWSKRSKSSEVIYQEGLIGDQTKANAEMQKNLSIFKELLAGSGKTASPMLSNFTGEFIPTPSTIIDGTAQFMVDRLKEDLNTELVIKFRNALKDSDLHLKSLMPSTYNVLLNSDPLKFNVFSNQLQASTRRDLGDLPINTAYFLVSAGLINQNTELGQSMMIALRGMQYQKNGFHPVYNLALLNQEFGHDPKRTNKINHILSLTNSVAQALFDNSKERNTSFKGTLDLISNVRKKKIFIALYAVKNKVLLSSLNYCDSNCTSIDVYKGFKNMDRVDRFLLSANKWVAMSQKVAITVDSLKKGTSEEAKMKFFLDLCDNFIETFDLGTEMYNQLTTYNAVKWEDVYKPVFSNIIIMGRSLQNKEYTSAIVALNAALEPFVSEALQSGESFQQLDKIHKISKNITYWGSFMGDLAEQSGKVEVNDLLKKYAEPSGSFRVKRQSRFSVTVNSYPGLFIGSETVSAKNATTFATGVTAPIGIGINLSQRSTAISADFDIYRADTNDRIEYLKYTGWVHGLFFPVIDIAVPFVYRWSSGETEGFPPDLKWEQVFSPGAYYSIAPRNSGLTFMAGVQYTPSLRKIAGENSVDIKQNALRLGFTITYDIPIFTLYKSGKK